MKEVFFSGVFDYTILKCAEKNDTSNIKPALTTLLLVYDCRKDHSPVGV